ncbi:MAG: energy-coupling factor transporter transmembrane protein EcfT [Eubacterium sp.]|nr:energy-coupling factor transporter transmembrane protein EcfT [Eubacterium sp.]
MKHLPSGMYQQGDSVIHRLDATIKMILLMILFAAAIAADSIIGYVLIIAFTAIIAILSRIGIHAALGSIRRMIWFFIVIFLMNLCFYQTDHAWFSFWIFNPSYDGMMQGVTVIVRVAVFLVLCNVLNSSTPPVEITNAIENIISPLRFIKVPTHQIALIFSVAIQFVPTLFEEADMIYKAQLARGARFDSHSLIDKAKAVLPMIVPIFISAFRRADELSLAMEARGYRVDVSSVRKRSVHFGMMELLSFIICTALCVIQIAVF